MPGLCRVSAVADGLMGGISEGVGRGAIAGLAVTVEVEVVDAWEGGAAGTATAGLAAIAGFGGAGGDSGAAGTRDPVSFLDNSLIRSTVDGSRLAKALTLTSRPHFWIRSRSSWLFKPSSFANSWTRVDNGNSSWVGLRPGRPIRPERSVGLYYDRFRPVVPRPVSHPPPGFTSRHPIPRRMRRDEGGGVSQGEDRSGRPGPLGRAAGAARPCGGHGRCISESRPSASSGGVGSIGGNVGVFGPAPDSSATSRCGEAPDSTASVTIRFVSSWSASLGGDVTS